MRLSYIYNGNHYTGRTASLYWNAPGLSPNCIWIFTMQIEMLIFGYRINRYSVTVFLQESRVYTTLKYMLSLCVLTTTSQSNRFNSISADQLVLQGARASADLVLIQLPGNTPLSALKGWLSWIDAILRLWKLESFDKRYILCLSCW